MLFQIKPNSRNISKRDHSINIHQSHVWYALLDWTPSTTNKILTFFFLSAISFEESNPLYQTSHNNL